MPSIRGQFLSIDEADATNPFFFKASSRATLAALGAQYGWPLYGVFIAGGENSETPDFILERHTWPAKTGADRAGKVQSDVEGQMEVVYKSKDADARYFWATCHVWNYRADGSYLPRGHAGPSTGDYQLYTSDAQPPANWWQEL